MFVGPDLSYAAEVGIAASQKLLAMLTELYAERRRYPIYTFLRGSSSPIAKMSRKLRKRARQSIVNTAVQIYAHVYHSDDHPGINAFNSDHPDRLQTYLRLAADLADPDTHEVGKGRGLLSVLINKEKDPPTTAMMLYATVNSDPKFVAIDTDDAAPRICQIWYLVSKYPGTYTLKMLVDWYNDPDFVFNEHFEILLNDVASIVQREGCDFITFEIAADEHGRPQEHSIKLMLIYQMYFRQMLYSWAARHKEMWPPAYRTPYVIDYVYKSPKFDDVTPANLLLCAVPISPEACSAFARGKIESKLARDIVRKVYEQYYEPNRNPEEMEEGIAYTNEVLGDPDSWPPEVTVIPFGEYISKYLKKYLKGEKRMSKRKRI